VLNVVRICETDAVANVDLCYDRIKACKLSLLGTLMRFEINVHADDLRSMLGRTRVSFVMSALVRADGIRRRSAWEDCKSEAKSCGGDLETKMHVRPFRNW